MFASVGAFLKSIAWLALFSDHRLYHFLCIYLIGYRLYSLFPLQAVKAGLSFRTCFGSFIRVFCRFANFIFLLQKKELKLLLNLLVSSGTRINWNLQNQHWAVPERFQSGSLTVVERYQSGQTAMPEWSMNDQTLPNGCTGKPQWLIFSQFSSFSITPFPSFYVSFI